MLNHVKNIGWIACLSRLALVGALLGLGWSATAHADESPAAAEPSAKPVVIQISATASTTQAGPVVLAYKFQPGQFVHYTVTSRVQYNSQVEDKALVNAVQTFTSVQSNDTWTHFRVVTVDEQGLALIEPVIDRTRMTAKLHNKEPVKFDSANPEDTQPEFRSIREAVGRSVARFQVSPTGKLVKAVVIDPTAPQDMREAAEKLDTRFPYLSPLPAAPVSVGDKWREEYDITIINNGLKEPIRMRRVFELAAVADGIATIKFRTIVMRPLNEPELEKQIIQQTPTGSIEFHLERGLVLSYTSNINSTVINAFGQQSLLNVTGTSTEKLATVEGIGDPAPKPAVVTLP